MKAIRACFFIVLMLLNCLANAQSVFSGANGLIPDSPADTCFYLSLTDMFPAYIDTTFGLQKICLNIEHPSPQELDITLLAPDSTKVLVSRQNGNGEKWEGVCFTMDATTSITAATDFFDEEVLPESNIGEVNNGQLATGLWQLCMADLVEGNTGSLQNWQLQFNFDAADPTGINQLKNVCTTNTTYGCVCTDGGDNCFLLPDLIVAEALTLQNFDEVIGGINFTTATSNIGYGPLEVRVSRQWYCDNELLPDFAMCEDGQWPKQLVKQRIFRKFPDQKAGFSELDAGFMDYQNTQNLNNRPQITSWVENSIRIKGADPNPLNWPVIVSDRKTAVCIENTLQCTNSNLVCAYQQTINSISTLPNSRLGQNYICNSNNAGIAVGYAHLNNQNIEDQGLQFSASTCNGTYYLVTQFDPDSIILELNESNNVSAVEIKLSEQVDNCCTTNFAAIQLERNGSIMRFEDLSVPVPNSWLWDFGNGNTSTTQFPVIEYDEPGEYSISLHTENELGCQSTISKTITVEDVYVGLEQFKDFDLKVLILDNKYIQFNLSSSKNITLNLCSANGQKVENIYDNIHLNKGVYTKEITNVPKGIYLVQAIVDGVSFYEKLILF